MTYTAAVPADTATAVRYGGTPLAAPSRARRARPPRAPEVRIAALDVFDGPTSYTQEQVLRRLALEDDESAVGVFARSGVRRRFLNLDDDFLASPLQGRTRQVEEELLERSIGAIDKLGVEVAEIGTVVSSSLYALGCPTLAHRVVEHYDMDPATDKYHVAGVGCASAVPLMRLAAQSLACEPERPALVVAAESMSSILVPSGRHDPKAKTIGSAIFGDGCGAALLDAREGAPGPVIVATQVHQLRGSLEAVTLSLADEDSYLALARELPELAAGQLAEVVGAFLRREGLDESAIDHWIVHPGGRRIVEGVRDALGLDDEDLASSWAALAGHGNVGTPSILYVMHSVLTQREPGAGEHGLAVTIGPGVTVGLMLLRW